jgi:hypothetical protein
MKKLLSFGAATLLTAAFLDFLFFWGIGGPVHWVRDLSMAGGGVVCYYLLLRK